MDSMVDKLTICLVKREYAEEAVKLLMDAKANSLESLIEFAERLIAGLGHIFEAHKALGTADEKISATFRGVVEDIIAVVKDSVNQIHVQMPPNFEEFQQLLVAAGGDVATAELITSVVAMAYEGDGAHISDVLRIIRQSLQDKLADFSHSQMIALVRVEKILMAMLLVEIAENEPGGFAARA